MKSCVKRLSRLLTALALIFGFLYGLKLAPSIAQTTSLQETNLPPWQEKVVGYKRLGNCYQPPDTSAMTERIIENRIPSHLPIKAELKNLDREPVLRHIEIVVTNISKKPMYCLVLTILAPEVFSEESHPIGFRLRFGRNELLDFDNSLRPEDVALQPGESHLFKIAETNLEAFDIKRGLTKTKLKLLYLLFSQIRFGDNTGYDGLSGAPYPPVRGNRSVGKVEAFSHLAELRLLDGLTF